MAFLNALILSMYGVKGENVITCTNQKGKNERAYRMARRKGAVCRDRNRKSECSIMLKDFREIGACGPGRRRNRRALDCVLSRPRRKPVLLFLVWLLAPVVPVVRRRCHLTMNRGWDANLYTLQRGIDVHLNTVLVILNWTDILIDPAVVIQR